MKIFDCFMYFDEDIVLDVRLNLLNEYVDKFIIVESRFDHRGEKRNLLFDKDKFQKFKDKIEYIVQEDQPGNLETINSSDNIEEHYRKSIFNAGKRESAQRNFILDGLKNAEPNDWIIISDLDEIPNLKKLNFKNIKNKLLFFKQDMMYYKFNLKLENFTWIGSRACKYKHLISPQWIREIKSKNFSWWRIDTFFSKKKYQNIVFLENGGWHFSYLKTPEDIEKKLKSYLHHIDYDQNPLGIEKIKSIVENNKAIYDLNIDQRKNKFYSNNELTKIDLELIPDYISKNKDKFNKWIEK
tara:strand:+ start:33 stop:926 length:894 start_codon:yes stop_codon:yes gene_type:complete